MRLESLCCTARSWLLRIWISESQFAGDLALFVVNRAMFELVGREFIQVGGLFGVCVCIERKHAKKFQ